MMVRRLGALAALAILVLVACEPKPGTVSTAPLLSDDDRLTYGAWAADMDLDGDQDLIVNDHGNPSSGLYFNDGNGHLSKHPGVFAPYPGAGDLFLDRHDCAVADVDQNGRPDIFCSAGSGRLQRPEAVPLQDQRAVAPAARRVVRQPVRRVRRGRDLEPGSGGGLRERQRRRVPRPDHDRRSAERRQPLRHRPLHERRRAALRRHRLRRTACGSGRSAASRPTDWNHDGFTDVAMCPYSGCGPPLPGHRDRPTFTEVTATHRRRAPRPRRPGEWPSPTWTTTAGTTWSAPTRRQCTSAGGTRRRSGSRPGSRSPRSTPQAVAVGRFDDDERARPLRREPWVRRLHAQEPARPHPPRGGATAPSSTSPASHRPGSATSPLPGWPSGTGRASFVVGNGHLEVPGPARARHLGPAGTEPTYSGLTRAKSSAWATPIRRPRLGQAVPDAAGEPLALGALVGRGDLHGRLELAACATRGRRAWVRRTRSRPRRGRPRPPRTAAAPTGRWWAMPWSGKKWGSRAATTPSTVRNPALRWSGWSR